jgi:hypothetical protein
MDEGGPFQYKLDGMCLRRAVEGRLVSRGFQLGAGLLAAAMLLETHGVAHAQLKGDYVAGSTGLQNGSQSPPGVSVFMPVYVYVSDTIKDDNGHTIGDNPTVTSSFFGPGAGWVTNFKLLGGNWGGQAAPVTFTTSRIERNSLDVPSEFLFTDMYFQPLQLGWTKSRADMSVGWGFFVPTGKWSLGGDNNSGLGMWSHDFQAGATLRLDHKQAWTTSMLGTYEIHSHKKDTDVKVGDILTLEGGTGRTFTKEVAGSTDPQVTNLGIVYYAQLKVSADSGTGPLSDEMLAGHKDRVFSAGAEGSLFLPKAKLLLDARLMPEFGARNRTEGTMFQFTVTYQWKSFANTSTS